MLTKCFDSTIKWNDRMRIKVSMFYLYMYKAAALSPAVFFTSSICALRADITSSACLARCANRWTTAADISLSASNGHRN